MKNQLCIVNLPDRTAMVDWAQNAKLLTCIVKFKIEREREREREGERDRERQRETETDRDRDSIRSIWT